MSPSDGHGPLAGRVIVLLRPPDASDDLAAAIAAEGGAPLSIPLSAFAVLPGAADRARAELMAVPDYLVFTSARGVKAVEPALNRLPAPTALAAVGDATAEALRDLGLVVAFVPSRSTAAVLAAELPRRGRNRVLAPLAELAGPDLEDGLTARGFEVRSFAAYRLQPLDPDPVSWSRVAAADAVVFTAPSVVDRFIECGGAGGGGAGRDGAGGGAGRDGFAGSVAISIGPRTTARLRERGWDRVIEATSHDRRGIVTALVASVGKDS